MTGYMLGFLQSILIAVNEAAATVVRLQGLC